MSRAYVCTIPSVPPSNNIYQRMHWSKRERVRREFQEQLWAVLNEKGNRCPRGLQRVELRAVLHFTERRRRDSDNFGATLWKFVQDVLVSEGVIPDDTADRCTAYPPGILLAQSEHTLLVIQPRVFPAGEGE